ncbi:MAG: hypothetical protein ACTSRE_06050 [Promethearchaeota archaeon]
MVTLETANRRIFNKQPYFTDKVVYTSKEEAKSLISEIKASDRTVKARIVEKAAGIFIYYDEHSFTAIKNGKFRNIIRKRKNSSAVRKPTKTTAFKPKSPKKKKSPKPELSILERQERLPGFLMKRLSKKATSILQKSILTTHKTSKKELEQQLDIIRSEQVKFDVRFEHEKEMIDYINRVAKTIEGCVREYEEQEAEIFVRISIIAPINRGEFKKQISKLDKKGSDEVAYLIFKKLSSRTRRKYPYSESRLLSQIRSFLTDNF